MKSSGISEFIDSNKDKVDTTLLGEAAKGFSALGEDKKMTAGANAKNFGDRGKNSRQSTQTCKKIPGKKFEPRRRRESRFPEFIAEEQEVHSELRALA